MPLPPPVINAFLLVIDRTGFSDPKFRALKGLHGKYAGYVSQLRSLPVKIYLTGSMQSEI
jgi:hypothetical protein